MKIAGNMLDLDDYPMRTTVPHICVGILPAPFLDFARPPLERRSSILSSRWPEQSLN